MIGRQFQQAEWNWNGRVDADHDYYLRQFGNTQKATGRSERARAAPLATLPCLCFRRSTLSIAC